MVTRIRTPTAESTLVEAVRTEALPLAGPAPDYRPLLDLVGDARYVLLGEASHGTQEFYRERARITRLLIEQKGFNAVAAEADWPDAYRVNCYVRGHGSDDNADAALSDFERFPGWMWRNTEVLHFVEWLREHNASVGPNGRQAGFYGLDLYSLSSSIDAVMRFLDKADSEAAGRARQRYACFEHFGRDTERYGLATGVGGSESCERQVLEVLDDLLRHAPEYARRDGGIAEDEVFFAQQNARLVRNAEEYYRSMFRGRASSWNLRDAHMVETLDALVDHLNRQAGPAKVVVWAHNSHLGDARATELGRAGELNVGQIVRERHGRDAVLIGFSTDHGTVTAASDWGGPAERKRVRPALAGSYEAVFHEVGLPGFLLPLRSKSPAVNALGSPRLERAIGVIYRPETERISHYFEARLPSQFDAVIHVDETHAVEPLERTAGWEDGELPETYPFAV